MKGVENTIHMNTTYLYGKSKTGKRLFWRIWMEPCQEGDQEVFQVITEHGEVGTTNPQQTKPTVFRTGKNIGKSNETTAKQQAEQYMKRKYMDKMEKQGYMSSLDEVEDINAPCYPMLANKVSRTKLSSLDYPAYAQPKLDGVRCVARMENGKVVLYSRTGKQYTGLWRIEQQLQKVFEQIKGINVIDGELGCFPREETKPRLTFQEICGYVKRKTKHEKDEEQTWVEYHIFDVILENELPWSARYQFMKQQMMPLLVSCSHLWMVETQVIANHKVFLRYHQENTRRGFEGTMYRSAGGKYKEKYRSRDLLKYKDMMTEEYPIIGAVEGKGNDAGTVVWVIHVNGKPCNVRPKGTRAERATMLTRASSYIGKMLTVQFQELTNDGIPRFPVGLVVRDYE